jgi:hypothetical protein
MPKDLFGVESNIAGAWHLDEAVLTIEKGSELLAMDVNINYGRDISPFSPINRKGRFLVGGSGAGNATIGIIVGPNKAVRDFLREYADLCKASEHVLTLRPAGVENCNDEEADPVEFVASGVALQGLSLSVAQIGQIAIVKGSLTLMITCLDVK